MDSAFETNLDMAIRAAHGSDDYRRAFEELVPTLEAIAYAYAVQRLGDTHLAQDAAQGALLTAWRVLPQLRDTKAFPSWFRRVVWTQCHLLTRGDRLVTTERVTERADDGANPHALAERAELVNQVKRAVDALPEHERDTATRFYLDGQSQREIAAALGLTHSAVSTRLHSARRRLKRRMIGMTNTTPATETPATPIQYAVAYARVFVSDYARARAFYVDTMGLQPVHEDGKAWMLFDTDGANLLVETSRTQEVGRVAGISFKVADIHGVHKTLASRGVRFEFPPTKQFWGGIRADFYDADGNLLTLVGDDIY